MINKVSGLTDKLLLAALLSVAVACGSVNTQEVAQSKAVRDRSRVLGLAQMDDGTYQFRLCRLHKTYTADILANECINPLVNEDGTEKVFNQAPEKPGTALAKFRNWLTAALAGTIAGVIIYKVGRFYVKTKARDRLVGRAMWERHKAKVDGAKAHNDFELVKQLGRETGEGSAVVGGKDFTQAIAFVENYGTKVEGNIEKARNAIKDALAKPLQADIDEIQESLQEAHEVLKQADSGFNLDSKPIQDLAQAIATLGKKADELRGAGARELGDKLQAMERDTYTIFKHVHSKEGLRLQLSGEEKKALEAVVDEDSSVANAVREWKRDKKELSLLDDEGLSEIKVRLIRLKEKLAQSPSDELRDELRKVEDELRKVEDEKKTLEKVFVGLKDVNDKMVEKLIRIDDVAMKTDRDYRSPNEKTILQLKQDIAEYEQNLKASKDTKEDTSKMSAKLAETEAALKERVKSYNPSQKQPMINEEQEKVGMAIKADPVIERAEEAAAQAKKDMKDRQEGGGDGLFANSLGKIGNGIKGGVKFLRGFPWLGEDTLAYGKLNKITITEEDKIVDKLAHGVKVENIEVQQGVEKLAAQTVGISAFLSLPLTAWSRYLPAHALLTAEKNWTEATGDYVAAKRIDDMLTVLDGIAQATDSKVTPSAITFGL